MNSVMMQARVPGPKIQLQESTGEAKVYAISGRVWGGSEKKTKKKEGLIVEGERRGMETGLVG
jgi:hypothetical protein